MEYPPGAAPRESAVVVRRIVVAALAALAAFAGAACANMGAPPGGPPRTTPPELLGVAPESGSVSVRARGVVFTFDEVLADRDFEKLFTLSPEDGRTRVIWRRERIEVRPRHGFRPNTAYSVTMLPGIADLHGNILQRGRTVVFSTGPRIPRYMVLGRVFDWMAERVAPNAVVQAIRRPDSLPFVGVSDSTGQFGVGPLDAAPYTVLAFIDNNSNRTLDRGEPWDSLAIVVAGGTSPFVELLAVLRDSIPPRLLTVTARDTLTLVATFDRPLNPDLLIAPGRFRLLAADSTPLRIRTALTKAQLDSASRKTADSLKADSSARADSAAAAVAAVAAGAAARRDTAALRRGAALTVPPPKPSSPPPPKEVTLSLDTLTPMHAGRAYRLTAIGVRGLLGGDRTSDRVFTVPRADTTRQRRDTSGARPRPPTQQPGRPPTAGRP